MIRRWHSMIFLVYVFLTCFMLTMLWYTHAQTYPLTALVGPEQWLTYYSAYLARLLYVLYIPWGLLLLASIALCLEPPFGLPRAAFVLTLILQLSILPVSVLLAVPVHNRHLLAHAMSAGDLDTLLLANAVRLATGFFSTGIVLWMLARLLPHSTADETVMSA